MSDECDPITVADDDGEVLRESDVPPGARVDRTADGSITSVVTPDGDWQIHVDTTTEFGARIRRIGHRRGETPEECVQTAIEEFLEEERERTR